MTDGNKNHGPALRVKRCGMYGTSGRFSACKDCTERHAGCHSTCQKYLSAKASWENEKRIVKEQKRLTRLVYNKQDRRYAEV